MSKPFYMALNMRILQDSSWDLMLRNPSRLAYVVGPSYTMYYHYLSINSDTSVSFFV